MNDTIFLLILLGSLTLIFAGGIITLIVYIKRLRRHRKTTVHILTKDHTWKKFKLKISADKQQFDREDNTYIFDINKAIRGRFGFDIYYYEGIMQPMDMDRDKAVIGTVKVYDGGIYHRILRSKLIEELFADGDVLKTLLILCIIILIVSFIILIFSGFSAFNHPPVIISQDNSTRDFIHKACMGIVTK